MAEEKRVGTQFEGRTALVTGAAVGIGAAAARAFAAECAAVLLADVNAEEGEQVAASIRAAGARAVFTRCDVSQEADVVAMVQRAVDEFGALHFAFNNAAIEGALGSTASYKVEDFDRVLSINVRGTWLCMKYEIEKILAAGGGAIVNAASVAGVLGTPGMPAYVASKHAVIGLTKTAGIEFAKQNLRVNAVCPSMVDTPMMNRFTKGSIEARDALMAAQPNGRVAAPEEIANAVVWLCSPGASYVNAHALMVDAGWVVQ
jgi:NAD(P)-dependent dehydrogenase (short-subunit alcohol dehydrogenase family)